jgi:hypothetical protein
LEEEANEHKTKPSKKKTLNRNKQKNGIRLLQDFWQMGDKERQRRSGSRRTREMKQNKRKKQGRERSTSRSTEQKKVAFFKPEKTEVRRLSPEHMQGSQQINKAKKKIES